ncbi:MAG TPA: tol-pal system protein YbgF [Myxococcales bacterium]|nr:tol-pal system protein YbgF [Myxococcales bacterium]
MVRNYIDTSDSFVELRIVTVVFLMTLIGCGTTNNELLLRQVKDLNQQLSELRKSQTGVEVTVDDLETRLFLVQDELDTYRKRGRNISSLPVVRVEPQNGPISIFDSNQDTKAPTSQNESGPLFFDRITDDGTLIRGGANMPEALVSETSTRGKRRRTEQHKPRLGKSEVAAVSSYKASYQLLKQQQYQDAIEGFRKFVEKNPTHGYADNAIYWMGECYYARGLWLQALKTFQQVIQNYPLGNKAPDAMLKVGLSHQQLKNNSQARQVLRQVMEIYPDSPVAGLADARLKQLP